MSNLVLIISGLVLLLGCAVLWRLDGLKGMMITLGFVAPIAIASVVVVKLFGKEWSWTIAIPVVVVGLILRWKRR